MGLLARLFNPRRQICTDHFNIDGTVIEALTPEGRVTVSLLQLNRAEHLAERELLISLDRRPCKPSE